MKLEQRINQQSNRIANLTLLIPLTEGTQRHEYQRDLRIAEAELEWVKEGLRLSQSTTERSEWSYWQSVDCTKRQMQQQHLQQQLDQQLALI